MGEFLSFLLGAGLCCGATLWYQRAFGGGGRKLAAELKRFFGGEVRQLPIVSRSFATVDLPNLQLAIDHYVETGCARARVVGYTSMFGNFQNDLRSLVG